jgi:phosphatidate cytidylyltransferase
MTGRPSPGGNSLTTRIAIGVLFAPLVVWLLWTGGAVFFAFLALITVLAQHELFRMPQDPVPLPHRLVAHFAGIAILADAFYPFPFGTGAVAVAALAAFFLVEIGSGAAENRMGRVMFSLFAVLYPAAFLAYLPKIALAACHPLGADNRLLLIFVVVAVWTYDTTAYFVGSRWGRHPFFASISPKKTSEGFIGGLVGTALLGAAAGFLPGVHFTHAVVSALLAGVAGQAGDLSESVIKRSMNVKDSSRLLLGHGGILDRFDSMFFAVPAVYGYLWLCANVWGGCG